MIKKGIIYLRVKCYLELDVSEGKAQDIVNELEYEINHELISDTNIEDLDF